MKRALLSIALLVGCRHTAAAPPGTASSSVASVVRPTPGQARTVEAFSGAWAYDATIQLPNEKPVTTTVGMTCDPILRGKAVACTMKEVFPGLGLYEGVFLVGQDPLDQKVHLLAVTSDDELHDHRCRWTSGTEIACETLRGGYGGEPASEDLAFGFGERGTYHSVATLKDGGKLDFSLTNGKKGTLPPPKTAEDAKPPAPSAEQVETADAFAGSWSLSGTLTMPDGTKHAFPLRIAAKEIAFGKGVAATMTGETPVGPTDAVFLVGHDPYDSTVHVMSITIDDALHDHRCKWRGRGELACEPLRAGIGGELVDEDLSFTFPRPGEMTMRSITRAKDGSTTTFEASGRR